VSFYQHTNQLADIAAESVFNRGAQETALESHLQALRERHEELERLGAAEKALAEIRLQMGRTLVALGRGDQAWDIARPLIEVFIRYEDFESAADTCDVLFQSGQPESISALGQGVWLAVTYPIDPELSVELLSHIIDETPDDADGAAVAATTALFLADLRAAGKQRENLMFFASQLLGNVARRHSGVDSQDAFELWMDRLELREPEKFLVRLRNVVDVLVQESWWFDRATLQERLPLN
jgi:tetratricopeptide (TPR) repeat protein